MNNFSIELIPDSAALFVRVHKTNLRKDGKIAPQAFDPTPYANPDGLSSNWSKYATPQETKDGAALIGKDPANYGVVSFEAGEIRAENLDAKHDPLPSNQAHTLIMGIPPRAMSDNQKTERLRLMAKWEIEPT